MWRWILVLCFGLGIAQAADSLQPAVYYWRSLAVETRSSATPTAQLLTLLCQACGAGDQAGRDVPLVSVLRDTLGDEVSENDRLTYVWLLTYSHESWHERALSAIPFFYWSLGDGSAHVSSKDTAPLLNLTAPQHPVLADAGRQLLQWTMFDGMVFPVRATSRAYRTNEVDQERLHLEEAISYLHSAPTSDGPESLTAAERDSVIARLELRKTLLGGFVSSQRVANIGKEAFLEQQRITSRNWELLRQVAEKTGLIFEPVNMAGAEGQYGVLWFPGRSRYEPAATNLAPIWKLLNIKDPYSDDRLRNWSGLSELRALDGRGALLLRGQTGASEINLIPLGFYSLTYPRQPLLLIDFRDNVHIRRHELLQRTIDEVTSGVIGISHITNWYYYVGADFYNFYQARRGRATSQPERLDCYSQFRVALALDQQLEPDLRNEMKRRVDSLSINPLKASPQREMQAASNRYSWLALSASSDDGKLAKQLDNERRAELASFGESKKKQATDSVLHNLTLGLYTHKFKPSEDNMARLDTYRRVQFNLDFLNKLVTAGTPPEVAYDSSRIQESVADLTNLMPQVPSLEIRQQAQNTLTRLGKLSLDPVLRADCSKASDSIGQTNGFVRSAAREPSVPGVATLPAAKSVALFPLLDHSQ